MSRFACGTFFRDLRLEEYAVGLELFKGSGERDGSVTQIARNGTPFLRIDFYLKLFWTIFASNPLESAWIAFFESANIGTFVGDQSAIIETGFKT